MTVWCCPLCRSLDLTTFWGCSGCGSIICDTCGAEHRPCPACGESFVLGTSFPERPLRTAEWRELLRAGWEGDPDFFKSTPPPVREVIASVDPSEVGEVDGALPEAWRAPFWDGIASFEVRRRIGLFDYLVFLWERRETRWDPAFEASLARLAQHRAKTSPGYAEELEARELLAGLEALGARAAFAADTMLEAAFDRRLHVRAAALAAIAAAKLPPSDALRWVMPRLEAVERGPREQAFAVLEAMTGIVWADPVTRSSAFDKRMLGVLVALLAGASDAELETLVDRGRGWSPSGFDSLIIELLHGAERWGSAIVDALCSPDGRERTEALEALARLSSPPKSAVPRLIELVSPDGNDFQLVAGALRALAPAAAAAIPPLEQLFATGDDKMKLLVATTLLTIHAAQSPVDVGRMRALGSWLRGAITDGTFASRSAARRAIKTLPIALRAEFEDRPAEPRPEPEISLSEIDRLTGDLDTGNDNDLERLMGRLRDKNQWPWDRESMIEALGRWHRAPESRAGELLAQRFSDKREDGRARIRAASALAGQPLANGLVALVRPALRDGRAAVRAWALLLLAESLEATAIEEARVDASAIVRRIAEHLWQSRKDKRGRPC